MREVDVIIAGGGPAGGALALALREADLAVAVVESRALEAPSEDARPIALSHGSRLLLERIGLWGGLDPATPIAGVHVSQCGGFGRVALTAAALRLPALGYVIDYARLASAVTHTLRAGHCEYMAGATLTGTRVEADAVIVEVSAGGSTSSLRGRLLVIADGGIAQGQGEMRSVDYRQVALTARVASSEPHRQVAYERFTADGPLALLPCAQQLALIWTTTPERAQALRLAPKQEFLGELAAAFGRRLGRFVEVGQRSAFPLSLRVARQTVTPRAVRIGNAAQTLHPVAGQGLNLALRDAWELGVDLISHPRQELGAPQALARYAVRRRLDRAVSVGFTHGLVKLFAGDAAPLLCARGLGMAALAAVPPLRDALARRMTFGARG